MNGLIVGNNYAEAYPLYEYLKYNVLPCKYNMPYLREKVREEYVRLLLTLDLPEPKDGELFPIVMPTPTVGQVADAIYDNCISTLTIALSEWGATKEMIEHMITVFDHDAAATLEIDIGDILWEDGYPSPTFKEKEREVRFRSDNPLQVQVIKGWC